MARGTFFLREQVIAPATQARAVTEIDLGAYVNLGSTKPQVLRIHSIQVQFSDNEGLVPLVDAAAAVAEYKSAFACVALTTKEMNIASPQMPFLSDDEIIVSVKDNGPGIPEDEIPKVFDHLFRGRVAVQDPNNPIEGTGLGLALAKTVIEQHGGRIWVESKEDEGSTFSFALPREPTPKTGSLRSEEE